MKKPNNSSSTGGATASRVEETVEEDKVIDQEIVIQNTNNQESPIEKSSSIQQESALLERKKSDGTTQNNTHESRNMEEENDTSGHHQETISTADNEEDRDDEDDTKPKAATTTATISPTTPSRKSSDTKEKETLRLAPGVDELSLEETGNTEELQKRRSAGSRDSMKKKRPPYASIPSPPNTNIVEATATAKSSNNLPQTQKDYKELHRMLRHKRRAISDSALSPRDSDVKAAETNTLMDTEEAIHQPGALAVAGVAASADNSLQQDAVDIPDEAVVEAELVEEEDKDRIEEAIREEVTQNVRDEILHELLEDAVQAEIVASNIANVEIDAESQLPLDDEDERKSHICCWFLCDCRIAVIVIDVVVIIFMTADLVAYLVNPSLFFPEVEDDVEDDGGFIAVEGGTVAFKFNNISEGLFVGFIVLGYFCMVVGILGAMKFNWVGVALSLLFNGVFFVYFCVSLNALNIILFFFFMYPHLVLISEIRHGIMTIDRYKLEKYCCIWWRRRLRD